AEGRTRVARGEELVVDAVMGLAVVVEVAGLARVAERGAETGPAGRVDGRMRLRLESGMAGRTVERGPVHGVGVAPRVDVEALRLPAAQRDGKVGVAVTGQAVLDGGGGWRVLRARADGGGGEGERGEDGQAHRWTPLLEPQVGEDLRIRLVLGQDRVAGVA